VEAAIHDLERVLQDLRARAEGGAAEMEGAKNKNEIRELTETVTRLEKAAVLAEKARECDAEVGSQQKATIGNLEVQLTAVKELNCAAGADMFVRMCLHVCVYFVRITRTYLHMCLYICIYIQIYTVYV